MTYINYAKCTKYTTDPLIVVKERKSKFTLSNASRFKIAKIKVDGCLSDGTTDQHKQCDWLFVISQTKINRNRALYVELKGCDVEVARSQLIETLEKTKHRYQSTKKECFIVSRRVPKYVAKSQSFDKEFRKKYHAKLFFISGKKKVDA